MLRTNFVRQTRRLLGAASLVGALSVAALAGAPVVASATVVSGYSTQDANGINGVTAIGNNANGIGSAVASDANGI